jgi:hypothetical protein
VVRGLIMLVDSERSGLIRWPGFGEVTGKTLLGTKPTGAKFLDLVD